jgi:C1A family cysteine protease
MARKRASYGWIPDLPDQRDHLYAAPVEMLVALPPSADLRQQCPPVYDQGHLGSCTANAIAAAVEFDRMKQSLPDFTPSRLFIYFNERQIEGHVANDAGAQIRDGIKTLNKLGVCPDKDWPYDDTPALYEGGPFPQNSKPAEKPDQASYHDARKYVITNYQRLTPTLSQLQGCLAAGFPFVFGFTVFASWYSKNPRPATISLPTSNDQAIGGHAVMCVGYDNKTRLFKIRNSWGASAGKSGYFFMPYVYLTSANLAADLWVINAVKD